MLAVQSACNLELYAGNVTMASTRLEAAWPEIERIGTLRSQNLRVELLYLRARIALAANNPEAIKIAEELVKEGATWANGLGHLLRAATQVARTDRNALASLLRAEEDFADRRQRRNEPPRSEESRRSASDVHAIPEMDALSAVN